MKKLLIFVLIFTSAQLYCVATKLQNGKRIDVERFELVCAILNKLKAENPALLQDLYTLIKNTRSKTKCFITIELANKLAPVLIEFSQSADVIWGDKRVIHPDVRHMIKAACKANEQGNLDVRRPLTKS